MQYTPYFRLRQSEPFDAPNRQALNQDLAKIDAAIQTVKISGDAALQALRATVNANAAAAQQAVNAKCQIITGTFKGDGASSRTFPLGFTPKAVIVEHTYGGRSTDDLSTSGGMALQGNPLHAFNRVAVEIVEGGFQVHQGSNEKIFMNLLNHVYYYVAFA